MSPPSFFCQDRKLADRHHRVPPGDPVDPAQTVNITTPPDNPPATLPATDHTDPPLRDGLPRSTPLAT